MCKGRGFIDCTLFTVRILTKENESEEAVIQYGKSVPCENCEGTGKLTDEEKI
jgi:RecJ-like exonuclease